MFRITCKCGKTTITFQNMSSKDFPDNLWITDCCLEGECSQKETQCCGNCKKEEVQSEKIEEKQEPKRKNQRKKKNV